MDDLFAQDINKEQKQIINAPTTTIMLGDNKTYEFKGAVDDMTMFDLKETKTKSEVRSVKKTLLNTLKEQNKHIDDGTVTYAKRRETATSIFKNKSSSLSFDSKWYGKDSPEMVRVKKTVNYMNNILDAGCEKYVKIEKEAKYIDGEAMKDALHIAFDEAHAACEFYISEKARKNEAKHTAGIRRLNKIIDIRNEIERERLKYDALADALQIKSLENFDVEQDMKKSPRELSTRHLTTKAEISEWQNQGNSTDVYRIVVKEEGKDAVYYIKENLPLLSSDPEGFLDRRIAQLEKSKENMDNEKVELRMKKANMDAQDYDAALTFLRALKKRINDAPEAQKQSVKQKIVELFSHDFDKMFTLFSIHNKAVEAMEEQGDKNDGKMDWEEIARDSGNPMCQLAKYILDNTKGKNGEKIKLEKKTAMEWIREKMGLTDADNDIISALNNLHNQKSDKGVEDLFRVSMGKEVELFGQMRDRSNGKGDEREIAAANNTGTFVLSKMCGFTDVVTESDMRIVRFKNRQGEMVESFCTVTKEAEGEEYLELLKKAEKEGKKIDYTPKAIRSLMRLQAFDTLCLQVDRHGRNFKCKVVEQGDSILITDVMSYDHDMSFLEEKLEDAFKDSKTGEIGKKGFLPPMTQRIKKGSPEYRYLREKYFGIKEPDIVKNLKIPQYRPQLRNRPALQKNVNKMLMDLPWKANGDLQLVEGDYIPKESSLINNYSGKIYKIPQDPGENASEEEKKAYREKKEKYDTWFDIEKYANLKFMRNPEIDKEFGMSEEEQEEASRELVDIIVKLKPLVLLDDSREKDKEEINKKVAEYKEKHPDNKQSDKDIIKQHIDKFKRNSSNEEKRETAKLMKRLIEENQRK